MTTMPKPTTAGRIWNIFFKGLLTVLPVALTIYLIVWLIQALIKLFAIWIEALNQFPKSFRMI